MPQATTKLKQALLTFIASQVTSNKEKAELQRTFQLLDKDGNGTLNKDELIEGYKRVFALRADAEEEARKILDQVDSNGSGKIDFTGIVTSPRANPH
jgi:calcium-dependent protein kinase